MTRRLPWTFERRRHRAFVCHRSQCWYRSEEYHITEELWNQIWTEELFRERGRENQSLCLTRRSVDLPWQSGNLAIVPRSQQLKIAGRRRRRWPEPDDDLFQQTVWQDYE